MTGNDLVERKAVINAIVGLTNCENADDLRAFAKRHDLGLYWTGGIVDAIDTVGKVPSAQPELIKQCAYVRGFEQGKTHGMLNAKQSDHIAEASKKVPSSCVHENGLISRQAVLDAILEEPTDAHYPSWYAAKIKTLPSEQAKQDDEVEFWKKRADEYCRIGMKLLKKLASGANVKSIKLTEAGLVFDCEPTKPQGGKQNENY